MNRYPKWLPKEVLEHSELLIKKGGLNTLKPLLVRLVTNSEMETVWKSLSSKTDDSQKLIDFLEDVRLHPALQGNKTDPIPVPSDSEQRKVFKKLNELSKRMIKEMRDLSPTGKAHAGWELIETALKRAELYEVQQASHNTLLEIKSIQSRLQGIQQDESIISLLELISSASQYAATAPNAALPKKRNTSRAKCNQLILFLKQYLKHHFNTESPSVIAAIVNTAFDSEDGGITVDDVRKLKANP
jgi:hypothetical protein